MNARRARRSGLVILALVLLGGAQPGLAGIVEYRIDGQITSASDPDGLLSTPVAVGDFFSIYFAYDTTASSYTQNVESTLFYNAIRATRIRIGGVDDFLTTTAATQDQISVRDDYHPAPFFPHEDALGFSVASGSIIDRLVLANWSMSASGPSDPTVLNSMALPGSLPNLALFDTTTANFSIHDGPTGQSASFGGNLLVMSPVPLPAPLLLLGSGLLGLLATRRQPGRSRFGTTAGSSG